MEHGIIKHPKRHCLCPSQTDLHYIWKLSSTSKQHVKILRKHLILNGFQKTSHGCYIAVFTLAMFGSIKANSGAVAVSAVYLNASEPWRAPTSRPRYEFWCGSTDI